MYLLHELKSRGLFAYIHVYYAHWRLWKAVPHVRNVLGRPEYVPRSPFANKYASPSLSKLENSAAQLVADEASK